MAPKVSVDVIGESGDASLGFTQLPDEILVDIMGYLDVSDVFTIRAVSAFMRERAHLTGPW